MGGSSGEGGVGLTRPRRWTSRLEAAGVGLVALASPALVVAGPVARYDARDAATGQHLYQWREWSCPSPEGAQQRVAFTERTFPGGSEARDEMLFELAPLRCLGWRRSLRDGAGERLGESFGRCDAESYPLVGRSLPPLTFPDHASLAFLVNHMGLEAEARRSRRVEFHVVTAECALVPMELELEGEETVRVPAGEFECHRLRLRPDLDALFPRIGSLLRPLLSWLMEGESLWVTVARPWVVVKFEGKLGPPGAVELVAELVELGEEEEGDADAGTCAPAR